MNYVNLVTLFTLSLKQRAVSRQTWHMDGSQTLVTLLHDQEYSIMGMNH